MNHDHTYDGPQKQIAAESPGGTDRNQYRQKRKSRTAEQMKDLIFANKIVKHSKSNAIVFAKNGMLLASGIGQTSRVDALKQAVEKAKSFGFDLKGAVMASDAFFPFADCAELAHAEGVDAIIQPSDTRKYVIGAFEMLFTKRERRPDKKHGTV